MSLKPSIAPPRPICVSALLFFLMTSTPALAADGDAVEIKDTALRGCLEEDLGKKAGETITEGDMAGLTKLTCSRNSVADLTGLEYATGVTELRLSGNDIVDLKPLSGLSSLEFLEISGNRRLSDLKPLAGLASLEKLLADAGSISDVSPLEDLTSLRTLFLGANPLGDISSLTKLTNLVELSLYRTELFDLSPLAELTNLEFLDISSMPILDLSAVGSLSALTELYVNYGAVWDVSFLRDNRGLKSSWIELYGNPLGCDAVSRDIPAIRNRGATVMVDDVPSAVPQSPKKLKLIRGKGKVRLSWKTYRNETVTIFEVRYAEGSEGRFSDWERVAIGDEPATTHVIALLDDNADYIFQVRGVNTAGCGEIGQIATEVEEPVADAGKDQTVAEDDKAWLDGSGSSAPGDEALTYSWRQAAGKPSVRIEGADTARPSFATPNLIAPTTLTFELTVFAGEGKATDTVDITIDADNDPPTARAGNDRTVAEDGSGRLDGGASSDPEGERIAYSWRQISGEPTLALTDANTATPSFTTPNLVAPTTLTFELTATAGGASTTDTVNITIEADNDPPTADAGEDQTVATGGAGRLDGRGSSDPENESLDYSWRQSAGTPEVSLAEAHTATPSFKAPSVTAEATLTFELTVTASGASAKDTVDVTVEAASATVSIADSYLQQCVEKALDKEAGESITEAEMSTLTTLHCRGERSTTRGEAGSQVTSLAGLEHATSLAELHMNRNAVLDFSPLSGLTSLRHLAAGIGVVKDVSPLAKLTDLTELHLSANNISDVTPLAGLTSLRALNVGQNAVSDISALTGLTSLTYLAIYSNSIADISAIAGMTSLETLHMSANTVADISAMSGLTDLIDLGAENNGIWDISALTANTGLGEGTFMSLANNPLGCAAVSAVAELEERGVWVYVDPATAAPAAPGNFAVKVANDKATLTWDGDETSPVRVYEARHRIGAEGTFGDWEMVAGGADGRSHTVPNMAQGSHAFEVRAVNSAGCSTAASASAVVGSTVSIKDSSLRRCVEKALNKEAGAAIAVDEMAELSGLTCRSAGIADLTGLEAATGLAKLDLSGNAIDDVSPLSALAELTSLNLRDNDISDVADLASNQHLGKDDTVDLRENPLDDKALSTHIPALQSRGATVRFDAAASVEVPDAALRHCLERELRKDSGSAITEREMASLERVNCRVRRVTRGCFDADGCFDPVWNPHGAIQSLEGLGFAVNLTELNIADNVVADLSPIAELPLRSLNINGNAVTDFSVLKPLLSLRTLRAGDNPTSNLEPLGELTGLTTLSLVGSALRDISPLAGLTKLRKLWLGGNAISDVSAMAALTSLEELDFSGNAISDISALAGLGSLTYLGLVSNTIVDVSPLRELVWLQDLRLRDNRIADVDALVQNLGLGKGDYIELGANPIPCGVNAMQVQMLKARGVTVYADEGPLSPPRELVGSPGDGSATLSWQPPQGCAVARYEYRQGTGKSPTFHAWTTIGEGTSHTVSGLANGLVHAFEVRAMGTANGSRGEASRVLVALAADPDAEVAFEDPRLSRALTEQLSVGEQAQDVGDGSERTITQADLATFTSLSVEDLGIVRLEGLEYALNLRSLRLGGNAVAILTPIGELPFLSSLWLSDNKLRDISALGGLVELTELALDGNAISDVSALSDMPLLTRLWLNDNAIADIAPLAKNAGLGAGEVRPDGSSDYLDLRGNPLDTAALDEHTPALRGRGAAVLVDDGSYAVPVFLAGGNSFGESFIRILNRTGEAGEVSIVAIDAAGRRFGPTTFTLGAGRTIRIDSEDLEHGNSALGIASGVGVGEGDWRLELRSALTDMEVHAYTRTTTGLVASMNVSVPEAYAQHRVVTFNPARSSSRASRLRVINPTAKLARALIEGVDDGGNAATVAIEVPAGATRDFNAASLEAGTGDGVVSGGLGQGTGKWQLRVTSYDGIHVLNLMSGGTQLTNLSLMPPMAEGSAGSPQHLSLIPASEWPAERGGFLRFVNNSAEAGSVEIRAFDRNGGAREPVSLAIAAGSAVRIGPDDLASGSAAKGLPTGVGEGVWRLELRSSVDVYAGSYLRAGESAPLVAMHGFAPRLASGVSTVVFFNPASSRLTSRLRLVNVGAASAQVTISGTDDRGAASGVVRTTIPAGATREFTAPDLETGDADGLSGALGDGGGKWRLRVESDGDIHVVSLIENATGYVENVSR